MHPASSSGRTILLAWSFPNNKECDFSPAKPVRHKSDTFLVNMFGLLLAISAMLAALGCSESPGPTLYAFDRSSSTIKVWDNMEAFQDDVTSPEANRTLTSSALTSVQDLAWGGMVVDSQSDTLYLCSRKGNLVRISRLRSQDGSVPADAISSFTISSDMADGEFGQISLDDSGTLYLTEGSASSGRVWVIQNASTLTTAPTAEYLTRIGDDRKCCGVAGGQDALYAFFGDGDPVHPSTTYFYGARVRISNGAAFNSEQNPLINTSASKLGNIGALAYDKSGQQLFICHRNTESADNSNSANPTSPPILVYRQSSLATGLEQTPDYTLGTFEDYPALRSLAHSGDNPWLAAVDMINGEGVNRIHLWKKPQEDAKAKTLHLGTDIQLRALAFGR